MVLRGSTAWANNFYPRPPRGGRQYLLAGPPSPYKFLSTPSARRATWQNRASTTLSSVFLSTPSARRATFSAHAWACNVHLFLSTPSARRATSQPPHHSFCPQISIHALREEGDLPLAIPTPFRNAFLSTPSARRATDKYNAKCTQINIFLSTPSARRATIATTAPLILPTDFYPRPPRGGRPRRCTSRSYRFSFLSTPSARRATAKTEKNISAFVSL